MRIISTLNLAHLLRAAGVYSEEKFLVTFEPTAAPAPRILHSTVILRGLNALSRKLNVSSAELFVSSNHTDNAGVVHIYVDRIVGGLIVSNQHSSVHLKNGQVIAMAGSIASTELTSITDSGSLLDTFRIRIMEETAIKIASDFYHSQSTGRANLILLNTEQGLEKFYEVGLSDADGDQRMSVLVNASSGEIISGNGLVKSYTYNAIPLPKDRPTSGFANIVNPENYTASPKGWSIKGSTYGNNARVILEAGAYHLQSNQSIFKGNWDRNNDPIAKANADAALANAFYAVNMMHDITYPYGFNEVAGNFQFNNFNKGGFENDNILVVIQDSTVPNNAMFTAAEDGVRGKLNLGIFQITNPNRDAALENSIIIHEYAHGVVGRLTGGRMRATCMYGPIPDGYFA